MSNGLGPDDDQVFLGLIWAQTVYKDYVPEQITLVGKKLKNVIVCFPITF